MFVEPYAVNIRKYAKVVSLGAAEMEALHQLRVNIRRLRSMLAFFKILFSEKQVKAWTKHLDRVSRATSAARDLDVYIAYLEQYKGKLPTAREKKPITAVLARTKDLRVEIQPRILKALAAFEDSGTLQSLSKAMAHASMKSRKESVYKIARKGLFKRVKKLLAYEPIVCQPDRIEDLHQMRIAAKHLRYSLEGLETICEPQVRVFIDRIVVFHSLLGAIHDFDVWAGHVTEWLKNPDLAVEEKQALETLREHLQAERRAAYERFKDTWTTEQEGRLFEDLLEHIFFYQK